jgi:hypothetical protein
MSSTNDNVKKLAPDLTTGFPSSPHAMLAGYVLAKRCVDKGRAVLAGTAGDYHFNCPLDNIFLGFAGLKGTELNELLASGSDDKAVAKWIEEKATKRTKIEIIHWNNEWRYKRIGELPDQLQEFMEEYVPQNVPPAVIHHVRYFFDIFDAEEKRFSH